MMKSAYCFSSERMGKTYDEDLVMENDKLGSSMDIEEPEYSEWFYIMPYFAESSSEEYSYPPEYESPLEKNSSGKKVNNFPKSFAPSSDDIQQVSKTKISSPLQMQKQASASTSEKPVQSETKSTKSILIQGSNKQIPRKQPKKRRRKPKSITNEQIESAKRKEIKLMENEKEKEKVKKIEALNEKMQHLRLIEIQNKNLQKELLNSKEIKQVNKQKLKTKNPTPQMQYLFSYLEKNHKFFNEDLLFQAMTQVWNLQPKQKILMAYEEYMSKGYLKIEQTKKFEQKVKRKPAYDRTKAKYLLIKEMIKKALIEKPVKSQVGLVREIEANEEYKISCKELRKCMKLHPELRKMLDDKKESIRKKKSWHLSEDEDEPEVSEEIKQEELCMESLDVKRDCEGVVRLFEEKVREKELLEKIKRKRKEFEVRRAQIMGEMSSFQGGKMVDESQEGRSFEKVEWKIIENGQKEEIE